MATAFLWAMHVHGLTVHVFVVAILPPAGGLEAAAAGQVGGSALQAVRGHLQVSSLVQMQHACNLRAVVLGEQQLMTRLFKGNLSKLQPKRLQLVHAYSTQQLRQRVLCTTHVAVANSHSGLHAAVW
jgi:hypothetical protein